MADFGEGRGFSWDVMPSEAEISSRRTNLYSRDGHKLGNAVWFVVHGIFSS